MIAGGCGGGSSGGGATTSGSRLVRGNGFVLSVPEKWRVRTSPISVLAAPGGDDVTLVAAYRLQTAKPYRPSLWKAAAAELDQKASVLATKLHGHIASESTTTVAHSRARQYVLDYGDRRARLTFFYRKTKEYELYCRWAAKAGEPSACALVQGTFTPSSS